MKKFSQEESPGIRLLREGGVDSTLLEKLRTLTRRHSNISFRCHMDHARVNTPAGDLEDEEFFTSFNVKPFNYTSYGKQDLEQALWRVEAQIDFVISKISGAAVHFKEDCAEPMTRRQPTVFVSLSGSGAGWQPVN